MQLPNNIHIKENSWLAGIAARKLGVTQVAMVLRQTIHLYGVSAQDFLEDERWVKHELCHVAQYRRMGTLPFLAKYLWLSIRYGYYNNPLEVEARAAEYL